MKSLSIFVLGVMAFAFDASADLGRKVARGYINENLRGVRLITVIESEGEVDGIYPLSFFTTQQREVMVKCMQKKDTHVIEIDVVPSIQTQVPTDMPGRTVTTHFPVYENVRCTKDVGFLRVWRQIVSRSRI